MASFGNLYANTKNKVEIIGDAQFSDSVKELYSRNRKTSCIETVNKKIMIRADAFPVRGKQNVGNLFGVNRNSSSLSKQRYASGMVAPTRAAGGVASGRGGGSASVSGSGVASCRDGGGKQTNVINNGNLRSSLMNGNYGTGNADLPYGTHIDVSWLPFAAGHYHISPDINDYVVCEVPILTSDCPNRNMQAFLTKTLFEFSVEYGCQIYKTYVGRPVCREHNNKDLSLAQGVVIDAFLVPVPKYRLVKLIILCLVDRTKNIEVARNPHARLGWSLGSLVGDGFQCSVCSGVLGPGVRRSCTCYHTNYTDLRSYGGIYNGRLHFLCVLNDAVFGEASIVSNPADISAICDML